MLNSWITQSTQTIDENLRQNATRHQISLTKPPGSLGLLEEIAIQFSGWQGTTIPTCERILIRVFAGDHGA